MANTMPNKNLGFPAIVATTGGRYLSCVAGTHPAKITANTQGKRQ